MSLKKKNSIFNFSLILMKTSLLLIIFDDIYQVKLLLYFFKFVLKLIQNQLNIIDYDQRNNIKFFSFN